MNGRPVADAPIKVQLSPLIELKKIPFHSPHLSSSLPFSTPFSSLLFFLSSLRGVKCVRTCITAVVVAVTCTHRERDTEKERHSKTETERQRQRQRGIERKLRIYEDDERTEETHLRQAGQVKETSADVHGRVCARDLLGSQNHHNQSAEHIILPRHQQRRKKNERMPQ